VRALRLTCPRTRLSLTSGAVRAGKKLMQTSCGTPEYVAPEVLQNTVSAALRMATRSLALPGLARPPRCSDNNRRRN